MTAYRITIFSLAYFLLFLINLAGGIFCWRLRNRSHLFFLSLLAFAVAWWSFFIAFESAAVTAPLKVFWSVWAYLGTVAAPGLFLIFALEYGQYKRSGHPLILVLLFLIPAITLLLAATNPYHSLVWKNLILNPGTNLAVYRHGPVYWLFFVHTYACLLSGLVLLVVSLFRYPPPYRRETVFVTFAIIVPILGNLAYLFELPYFAGFDWTLVAISLSILFYTLGIVGTSLFSLLPVPRGQLFELIQEGVIFLDPLNRILDINQAAGKILNSRLSDCFGKDILELYPGLSAYPQLLDRAQGAGQVTEIMTETTPPSYLELRTTLLYDQRENPKGKLIFITDITAHRLIQKSLKNQAQTDPLTGVFNRRFMEEIADGGWEKLMQGENSLGVIMLDIDHFKTVNDTMGHAAGDEVLKMLIGYMNTKIRNRDLVFRYGGEEFLVLLPGMKEKSLVTKAESWRKGIQAHPFSTAAGKADITVSLGLAVFPGQGETLKEAIKAADTALLEAKDTGRNRVVFYTPQKVST